MDVTCGILVVSLRRKSKGIQESEGQAVMAFPPQSHVHVIPPESSDFDNINKGIAHSPSTYRVHDSQQMVWVLTGNSLTAVPASNNVKPGRWHVMVQAVMAFPPQSHVHVIPPESSDFDNINKGIAHSPSTYRVHDSQQMVWVLTGNSLTAVPASNNVKPGRWHVMVQEVDIMNLYKEGKAQKAFLFYHGIEGSTSVFQSVFYPGWFIATSPIGRQTIILTHQRGKSDNTNFYIESEN
ncbi:interleukin-36 beta-like [Mus pahari]|uniref:interleukin-36 beta-like n=1 Tax=Mus pahari TaxID=10093 RepID=UPI000A30C9B2|nr:interleukin-36 beta-like [Mus pahari]